MLPGRKRPGSERVVLLHLLVLPGGHAHCDEHRRRIGRGDFTAISPLLDGVAPSVVLPGRTVVGGLDYFRSVVRSVRLGKAMRPDPDRAAVILTHSPMALPAAPTANLGG